MTTLDKFIGRTNLFFAFFSLVWFFVAMTESDFNIYKALFWFVVGFMNMLNYINYKWNGN